MRACYFDDGVELLLWGENIHLRIAECMRKQIQDEEFNENIWLSSRSTWKKPWSIFGCWC
jgi:hypothetical protein